MLLLFCEVTQCSLKQNVLSLYFVNVCLCSMKAILRYETNKLDLFVDNLIFFHGIGLSDTEDESWTEGNVYLYDYGILPLK